ncbi:hypothetical protein ACFFMN_14035 [Planobispora siamensis]|uniref:4-amino-4-deoxy-L-arabinose transferase n=1 Tax=Planobispora siamensis TaxID=936338 RepID=A0A8J3SBE1_9ACTN|nr:hypothetical protein [Planobispora siamensis]GIH89515.1 hypothetical protein Psi01_01450 [Planobispora siamensis]
MLQGLKRRESGARPRPPAPGRAGRAGDPAPRTGLVAALTSPVALLAAVAFCYALAQIFLTGPRMGLGYDETVYVSQFSLNGKPAGFHASRGWGTPVLAAPVVSLTDSIVALRMYMTTVSAVLLFLAFRLWLPLRPGYAVPVAAALFAAWWPSVFYGHEVMPNLYTALGTVALTGLALRAAAPGARRRPLLLAAVAVVAAVLPFFRPSDALIVAVAVGGVTAVMLLSRARRRPAFLVILALGAGSAVAFGQWVLEALLTFGGIRERVELGTQNFGEVRWLVGHHIRALDGPTLCSGPVGCGPVPVAGVAWLAVFLLLAAGGLVAAWRREHRIALVAAIVVGTCIALAYLYYPAFVAPRYLAPAYALWSFAAAEGFVRLLAVLRHRAGTVAAVACCALLTGGYLHVQNGYLAANVIPTERSRSGYQRLADELRKIEFRRPCLIYGWNAPQVAYLLNCEARSALSGKPFPATPDYILDQRIKSGYHIMAIFREDVDMSAPYLRGWPRHLLTSGGWYARINHDLRPSAPAKAAGKKGARGRVNSEQTPRP